MQNSKLQLKIKNWMDGCPAERQLNADMNLISETLNGQGKRRSLSEREFLNFSSSLASGSFRRGRRPANEISRSVILQRAVADLSIFLLLIFIFPYPTFGETMSNNNYILHLGTFSSVSGSVSNTNYKLNFTGGQTSPGLYTGTNYKVKAGFQNVRPSNIPFSFSISQSLIDFGILSATNPVTRTNALTVSNGKALGYKVIVSQDHSLKTQSGDVIPDTACDNGDCSTTKAAAWTSSLAYGFGYRCDNLSGSDCDLSFAGNSFFKPFSASPSSQTVMSGLKGRNKKGQITYKVNISAAQPAGIYTNSLTYIATPNF